MADLQPGKDRPVGSSPRTSSERSDKSFTGSFIGVSSVPTARPCISEDLVVRRLVRAAAGAFGG